MATMLVDRVSDRRIRPTRTAIVHGFPTDASEGSSLDRHQILASLFSPLRVRVFAIAEIGEDGLDDLISSGAYDVVGVIGEDESFLSRKRTLRRMRLLPQTSRNEEIEEPIVLSFIPATRHDYARRQLSFSDAVILCETREGSGPLAVFSVVFRFFESLLVPSMLNVDLADVRRIAKGVGLAFDISEDDHKRIIGKLPRECFLARSAILHFSCRDDVQLREIYAVAKSIALKKGLPNFDGQLATHSDAKKIIRKVNVKMGIRIVQSGDDSTLQEISTFPHAPCHDREKRINLAGIIFGT